VGTRVPIVHALMFLFQRVPRATVRSELTDDDEHVMETSLGEGNNSWSRTWNRPGEWDTRSASGPWACNSIWVHFVFENSDDLFSFLFFMFCNMQSN
jgi:hypothetical protein